MTEASAEEPFDDTFDEAFDDEVDIEAPEADRLEQHTAAAGPDRGGAARREAPLEANDADAAEQDRADDYDDDEDYR